MIDILLFGAFPYVAVGLLLAVSIRRYVKNAYTISSLSSQFLESKQLFWGSVPFHLGIMTLLVGHVVGFLVPRGVILWNASPLRMLILETTGLVAALAFLFGLVMLIVRRATSSRIRVVTSVLDVVVYNVLVFMALTGLYTAVFHRWGSAWYAQVAVPYLWSLVTLKPDLGLVSTLPWVPKLHMVGAFVLVGLLGFTRLVHALVAPIPYLWRNAQLVVWNRDRRAIRRIEG